eukprot:8592726-Pyramimonas_sp.AAC.1
MRRPRGFQEAPKRPPTGPKNPHVTPKTPRRSKRPPGAPRGPRDAPRGIQQASQETPGGDSVRQLAWASFLEGLVGRREASSIGKAWRRARGEEGP